MTSDESRKITAPEAPAPAPEETKPDATPLITTKKLERRKKNSQARCRSSITSKNFEDAS